MRAAVTRDATSGPRIEQVTLRDIGPREVRVRYDAAAMCITDVGSMHGGSPSPHPFISGHSATGVIEAVGSECVSTRVGDRIVLAGSFACGRCYFCRHDSPSQCVELWGGVFDPAVVGRTDDGAEVRADGGAGAFSEEMILREGAFAVVSSDLPVEQLAMLGCGGISGYGAVVEVGRARPGDSVAVFGTGSLGLWMIQTAHLVGAEPIAIEPDAARRALALRLGAVHAIDPTEVDAVEAVRALTGGRGADVGLDAGGTVEAMQNAVSATRNGGVAVLTSMVAPVAESTLTFPAIELALLGKQVRGSQSGGGFLQRDIPTIARLIEEGRLDAASLISRSAPLDGIGEIIDAARHREGITGIIRMDG